MSVEFTNAGGLRAGRPVKSPDRSVGLFRSAIEWTRPLHLPNRLLRQTISAHAHVARHRLLDVGCGEKPYRGLFPGVDTYVGMDREPGPRVDVLGDALALPFENSSFDTVMCNQVLEHVAEPSLLLNEVARVLEPGGYLLLTTPQTWGLHLEPHDYYRYTPHGLRYQSEKSGLVVVELDATSGLWATLAARIADTVIHVHARGLPRPVVIGLRILLVPVQLAGAALDAVFGKQGDALDNMLVAVKPAARADV